MVLLTNNVLEQTSFMESSERYSAVPCLLTHRRGANHLVDPRAEALSLLSHIHMHVVLSCIQLLCFWYEGPFHRSCIMPVKYLAFLAPARFHVSLPDWDTISLSFTVMTALHCAPFEGLEPIDAANVSVKESSPAELKVNSSLAE